MPSISKFSLAIVAFCVVVVVLGAYTRLTDAGLGCPDWPGCYGHLDVPKSEQEILAANAAYPERPVEIGKAWTEMVHRYVAGTLGLLILGLAIWAWRERKQPGALVAMPMVLLGLVIFQALLGMWTVTLLVKPAIVTMHLLGGFATLALAWWYTMRRARLFETDVRAQANLKPLAMAATFVLVAQITLGGWTSTNYAALACTDFPTCQQQWVPPMDFKEGFVLWRGLGIDYEFGVLDSEARTAIHMTHRIGAVITLIVLAYLALKTLGGSNPRAVRYTGTALLLVLLVQISLGIGNVVMHLPIGIATAHNAVGALLLLVLLTLNHVLRPVDAARQ